MTQPPDAPPPTPSMAAAPLGWGPPPPAFPMGRPKPPALPQRPTEYPQLLRSPRRRWWRPLVALGIALGLFVVLEILITVAVVVYALASGVSLTRVGTEQWLVSSPGGFAILLLSLISFIPISLFSMRLAFGTRIGYLASVAGRFRFRWALRCLLCVLPIWVALMVVDYLLGGFTGGPAKNWPIMMAMVVVGIPLQAAGEEFGFRGFFQQVIGSWLRNRWVALVVPAIVAVPAFAAAHGSFHFWTFTDLAVFAAAAVYLTWRTGGLEAAIAMHAVNNMLLMLTSLALGGFQSGFVTQNTRGSWVDVLITACTCGLAVVVITWQARRTGIQRLFRPVPPVPPPHDAGPYPPAFYNPIPGGGPTPGGGAQEPWLPQGR